LVQMDFVTSSSVSPTNEPQRRKQSLVTEQR
jgi:hypothetical protein